MALIANAKPTDRQTNRRKRRGEGRAKLPPIELSLSLYLSSDLSLSLSRKTNGSLFNGPQSIALTGASLHISLSCFLRASARPFFPLLYRFRLGPSLCLPSAALSPSLYLSLRSGQRRIICQPTAANQSNGRFRQIMKNANSEAEILQRTRKDIRKHRQRHLPSLFLSAFSLATYRTGRKRRPLRQAKETVSQWARGGLSRSVGGRRLSGSYLKAVATFTCPPIHSLAALLSRLIHNSFLCASLSLPFSDCSLPLLPLQPVFGGLAF